MQCQKSQKMFHVFFFIISFISLFLPISQNIFENPTKMLLPSCPLPPVHKLWTLHRPYIHCKTWSKFNMHTCSSKERTLRYSTLTYQGWLGIFLKYKFLNPFFFFWLNTGQSHQPFLEDKPEDKHILSYNWWHVIDGLILHL